MYQAGSGNLQRALLGIIFALIFFLSPAASFAQTSLNLPIGDKAYDLIDKLFASGLIKTPPFVGQRPWTREYAAGLVKEALETACHLSGSKLGSPLLSSCINVIPPSNHRRTGDYHLGDGKQSLSLFNHRFAHKRFVDAILKELAKEFSRELSSPQRRGSSEIIPLEYISLTYTGINTDASTITTNPPNNIDGVIDPLVANRQGDQYSRGHNFYWETAHSAQISPYFAAYLHPQFQFRFPSNADEQTHAYIKNIYIKTGWRNIELEVGRDNIVWGEGLHGGLALSDNPRGLDMIKLSSPRPFYFPWFFKYLGLFKITGFLANQGDEYNPGRPFLAGYRMDNNAFDCWNLNFSQIIELGGQNYSSPPFWKDVVELIGIPVAGRPIDRLTSVDTKITLKALRGLAIYGEALFQNYDLDKIGWMGGIYAPRLDYTGKWTGRIEFERIGENTYTQLDYLSGWTINRVLMGNITGPDSIRVTTTIGYNFTPLSKLSANLNFLNRSINDYNEYHAMNVWTLDLPLVRRRGKPIQQDGTNPSIVPPPSPGLFLHTSFGWDYVTNKNFVQGNKKADFMGEVGLKLGF